MARKHGASHFCAFRSSRVFARTPGFGVRDKSVRGKSVCGLAGCIACGTDRVALRLQRRTRECFVLARGAGSGIYAPDVLGRSPCAPFQRRSR
jgi:hypothetical protein